MNAWWCGIGSNIFLKTGMTVVCLSLPAWHGSEYHYDKGKKIFYKKCYSISSRTFLITRESEDEQRPVLVSAQKYAKNYPSRKLECLSHQQILIYVIIHVGKTFRPLLCQKCGKYFKKHTKNCIDPNFLFVFEHTETLIPPPPPTSTPSGPLPRAVG